jgi:hypothetical protein
MFSADIAGSTSASGPYLPYEILEDYRGPDQIMSKLDTFDYEIVHRSPGTTLETAKVVIILEKHDDEFYAKFYGLVLNRFYNSRQFDSGPSDILFIEAPTATELWKHIFSEVKLYSKLDDRSYVQGWGNFKFYVNEQEPFEEMRRPIINSGLQATSILYQSTSSNEDKIEAERIIKEACPLLKDVSDLKVLASEASSLLLRENRLFSEKTFIANQEELIKKINSCYKESKTLFFTCGKHHGHLRSFKKARQRSTPREIESVEKLYQNLEGKQFIIIYPKNPKKSGK